MKTGYSILLGELLSADDVGYEDCAKFQIVCPECREPTFKSKKVFDDTCIEYFSHYKASLPEQRECALRVQGYSDEFVQRENVKARNQRLKFFLDKFSNVILGSDIYETVNKAKVTQNRLNKSKALQKLYPGFISSIKSEGLESVFDECSNELENQLRDEHMKLHTSFAYHVQKRIGKDMWKTLFTPPEAKNLKLIFNHAVIVSLSYFLSAQQNSNDPTQAMFYQDMFLSVGRMNECRKASQATTLLNELSSQEPFGNGISYIEHIFEFINKLMVEALHLFPYAELLQEEYGHKELQLSYQGAFECLD